MVRLTAIKPDNRCAYAILYGATLQTRCMKVAGHGGQHTGKGLKKFPYQRIEWFAGDAREYVSDKEHEWTWSDRRPK